jgi:hypothetical protein
MSPNVQAVVVPLAVLLVVFGPFYLNIQRAKKRVSYWRPGSSYWFLRSSGLRGVKARATQIWVKDLGYEEPEALVIAACQGRARTMSFIGSFSLLAIPGLVFGP